jgi:hypothetical protein
MKPHCRSLLQQVMLVLNLGGEDWLVATVAAPAIPAAGPHPHRPSLWQATGAEFLGNALGALGVLQFHRPAPGARMWARMIVQNMLLLNSVNQCTT